MDHPFSEIPNVDQLKRISGVAECENLAPALDPQDPVGESVGRITGADYISRAKHRRTAGKALQDQLLAPGLHRPEVAAALDVLGVRIRQGRLEGRVFV